MELTAAEIHAAVRAALAEDIGSGDATTLATVPADAQLTAAMVAREPLVLAGRAFAEAAFRELAPTLSITYLARDGEPCRAGQTLLHVSGPARAILTAERVALNFVQRLSGVATLTDTVRPDAEHVSYRALGSARAIRSAPRTASARLVFSVWIRLVRSTDEA